MVQVLGTPDYPEVTITKLDEGYLVETESGKYGFSHLYEILTTLEKEFGEKNTELTEK